MQEGEPFALISTSPVGVPAGDETVTVTVTGSPGFDGPGSALTEVVVLAFSTSILVEVAERKPSAAKISLCVPLPLLMLRSLE